MELQSGLIMLDGLKQFIMYDNEDVRGRKLEGLKSVVCALSLGSALNRQSDRGNVGGPRNA